MTAHGFRDLELEAEVLELTRQFGIGAQFGGRYFCHDVRVIRLPRHGASLPGGDRGLVLGRPAGARQDHAVRRVPGAAGDATRPGSCPTSPTRASRSGEVVRVDLNRPMAEIRAELSKYPVKTRLSLTGPLVVARDIAHAKIAERLDAGEAMPQYLRDHAVYYAGPAKTPEGYASGSFGPTTAGRMDAYVERFQAAGGSLVMLAKGNRSTQVTDACATLRRLLPRLDRRPGGPAGPGLHQAGRGAGVPGTRHGSGLEDRGRGLPGVHRRRRQGQRLLRRGDEAGAHDWVAFLDLSRWLGSSAGVAGVLRSGLVLWPPPSVPGSATAADIGPWRGLRSPLEVAATGHRLRRGRRQVTVVGDQVAVTWCRERAVALSGQLRGAVSGPWH